MKSIRVICAYERNGNVAYFDNLSLTQEVAQTMKYDKEGKLVSVKSTGKEEETSKYENGNLKELVTGGNGTYTYDYDKDHNLKSVTNDYVKDTLTHDSMGNTLTSTIESAKTSAGKIVSSSAYTNGGNLLSKVTQRGNSISYGYSGAFNKMTGLKSDVTDPSGVKASYTYDAGGRTKSASINSGSLGTVSYDYTKSMLTKITRTASGKSQVYNLTYDAFGNMTKMAVGSRTLMTYEYGAKNGLLTKQTYANGASASFQYDALGRSTKTTTSSGDEYTYRYTGDGQLYELTDKNGGSPIRYTYNYDTIGRLIGTGQTGGTAELRASYQYDTNNRLTRMSYSIPGVVDNATESFYYNGDGSKITADIPNASKGVLKSMALFSNSWITYSYDDLSRLSQRRVGDILDEHYTYLADSGAGTTTTLPETHYTTLKGSSTKQCGYRYAYDSRNNITRITDLTNSRYWAYQYDKLGQLHYATDYAANGVATDRYTYEYDHAGNLTSCKIQNDDNTILKESHTYTYGNSEWKDLLTAFDGKSITYDANGNPTKYYNGGTMTWRNGRQLSSYSLGETTYNYEYDVNGLRTRKTNADGGYTEYYIVDGLAVAEQRHYASGAEWYTMRYLYDESNNPVGFGMQYPAETGWQNYYFAKNVQGDIIAIYRYDYNASTQKPYGTLIATYQYDPWGKPQGIKDASGKAIAQTANHVATYNPFRYRGYRYDVDTGLYYLQSRYYDPMTCRFVNADTAVSTGQGITGNNMFSYCMNNPINQIDCYGDYSIWYVLKTIGQWGLIHKMVQMHIKGKYEDISMEMWIKKDSVVVGRADLVDKKGSVWEVKHGGGLGDAAMTLIAKAQANKYIHGKAMRDNREIIGLGAAKAFKGEFTINCLDSTYQVTYSTPAAGVVLYYVKEIGKMEKANYYITVKEFSKLQDLIDEKIKQHAPGAAVAVATVAAAGGMAAVLGAYSGGGVGGWILNRASYFN